MNAWMNEGMILK